MSGVSGPAVALIAAVLCACGPFQRLRSDLVRLDTDQVVRGRINEVVEGQGSVYLVVFRWPTPEIVEIIDVAKHAPTTQEFLFLLPSGSDYLVAAVQDLDGNDVRDPGDPVWYYGDPTPVPFGADRRSELLDVRLAPAFRAPPAGLLHAFARARAGHSVIALASGRAVPIGVAEVADLDAPRFSAAAGTKGLWEPVAFLNEYGAGVFFVEPYDPKRLPVLFVNGAGGSPQNFRHFFAQLDRAKYQTWFFLYPSGLPLDVSARMLDELVEQVHEKHPFGELAVVAHSMGGLVARAFVQSGTKEARSVRTFVTLSSPWRGHEAAALGVKYAPAAVPSWRDMEPGSPFQRRIFERPLDPAITTCLGFTFRGKLGVGLPINNDGAVSLESQLAEPAQSQAALLRGFDETHTSVLQSAGALELVARCLAGEEEK